MGTTADKLQAVLNSKNAIKEKFGLPNDMPFSKYAENIKAGEDVTLGVVDAEGKFQPLTFEGTTASNNGESENVVNYHSWNSTLPPPEMGDDVDLSFITAKAEDILEGKVSVDTVGNQVIGTLQKGTDVSETTATANDVKQGKQFYDAEGVLTQGTNTDVNVSATTATAPDVLEGKQFYSAQGVLTQGTLVPDISITIGYVTTDKKFQPIVFDGTVGTPFGAEEDINTIYRCDIPDTKLMQPLTFIAEADSSTVQLNTHGALKLNNIQYRANGQEEWKSYNIGDIITLQNVGDQVQFQNLDNTLSPNSPIYDNYAQFRMTGVIAASGNIQSMLNWSTTLTEGCYEKLFYGCSSLTKAPVLPATTLVYRCYYGMFMDCTSLTEAPKLSATTLADYCCHAMFFGCTSLIKAPELLATTLVDTCYNQMFQNCTNLQSIKTHIKEWGLNGGYMWLYNVAPTGIFYKPSELPDQRGYNYIPEGWEVVNID